MLLIHNKIYMSSYIAFALFTLLVFYSNMFLGHKRTDKESCHFIGVSSTLNLEKLFDFEHL